MIVHQIRDPFPDRATALEPLEHFLGHRRAFFRVAIKSNALPVLPETNRLRHVVQQTTVGESFSRCLKMAQKQKRMSEYVAFGMVIRALPGAYERDNFRQQDFQQPALIQKLKAAARAALGENAGYFVADAFPRDLGDRAGQRLDRRKSQRINFAVEA